jgi:hypothetical protein
MTETNEFLVILISVTAFIILNAILVFLKKRYILSGKFFMYAYGIFYGFNIVIFSMLFFKNYYQYVRPIAMLDLVFLYSIYVFKNQYNGLFLFFCYVIFRSVQALQLEAQNANRLILVTLKAICLCFCQFTILMPIYYQSQMLVLIFVLLFLAFTDIAEMFIFNNINIKAIFINQIKYIFAAMSIVATYNIFIFIFCLMLDYSSTGISYIKRKIS